MPELEVHDKLMPLTEAVRKFIPDGIRLRGCGIGLKPPMAFVYEVIRQRRRDLTFLLSGWTEDADLMIGAGCVEKLEGSYLGLGGLRLPPRSPRRAGQGG